jgi:hypothetical protein
MRRSAAGIALAAAFLIAGFALLRDYGVNWDEALGDLYFGQQTLHALTGLAPRFDFSVSPFRAMPEQYYPFANAMAMATAYLLAPALDVFDGFHAFNILLGALFIVTFFLFLQARTSRTCAAAAVALLFTSPRIWYDAMVNVKDFPEMVLFTLAAMAYFVAWERDDVRWYLGAGVLWGLALATKTNAAFLPVIVLIFALLTRRMPFGKLAAMFATGLAVMFAVWPWLWSDPIGHLRKNLEYVANRVTHTPASMTTSPFAMLAFTTQPLFLLLIVAGVALAFVRRRPVDNYLLIWSGVLLARAAVSVNFDGVRHFLELFPPLAALAGASLLKLERRAALAAAAITIVPGLAGIIHMHPFEDAYWNALRGARTFPQSGEYWATSYRQGIDWLNAHAPQHSALAVPIAEQTVAIVAPFRLRRDIELVRYAPATPPYDPQRLPHLVARARRQPVFVMFIRRDENGNELTRACIGGLKPVAQWSRDGVPLLDIYELKGVTLTSYTRPLPRQSRRSSSRSPRRACSGRSA